MLSLQAETGTVIIDSFVTESYTFIIKTNRGETK